LQAAPDAVIHYSTDGSDPRVTGATYDGEFIIPLGTALVQVYAERDGISSQTERFAVQWDQNTIVQVDPRRPATWRRKFAYNITQESYEFLARASKHHAELSGVQVTIQGEGGSHEWIELSIYQEKRLTPAILEEVLMTLRKLQGNGQVRLVAEKLHFELGQDLLDWVEEIHTNLEPGEVQQ